MGDVVGLPGSGREFACRFAYKVRDEAGGIARALGLAEDFTNGQPLAVILGDNIFQANLRIYAQRFLVQGGDAWLLLKRVSDPRWPGVAEICDGKVLGIEEKPAHPRRDHAIIGVYFYDSGVFDIIRTLTPSGRGGLEITDVHNAYLRKGQLSCEVLEGWWTAAGTFDALVRASDCVLHKPPE